MTYPGFVWKNGMRNKRRAILTMMSVALAVFVMATLVSFVAQLDRNMNEASPLRLITRHAVSLTNSLPERYRAQIEKIPGVVAVSELNWFGGIYIDEAHTDFAQFACDARTLFDVFDEVRIPPDQKEAFMRERTAAVIGRRKAEKHGLKLGDRITIKPRDIPIDVPLELTIRGIFEGTVNNEAQLFFHRDYLEEVMGRPGWVGTYWIRVDSPESVSRVSETIDALFQNTEAPTKTETERAFNMSFVSMLGNLKQLVATISGVIIFTLLLVTGNTMAMSVRERIREIAVLKSLGFHRGEVLRLLVAEGVLITVTGGLAGCLAARVIFGWLDLGAFSLGFFQQVDVTWPIIAAGLAVSAVVGIVSAGIPALRAANLTVAEGLRHVG
ncbi:MAG TPA: FtsX-like permease family protein [Blastocatellia bacterium]|nr:FtsX-like permease family protein [Blastocatellia bacterium]